MVFVICSNDENMKHSFLAHLGELNFSDDNCVVTRSEEHFLTVR